jgi:hypothetical protein
VEDEHPRPRARASTSRSRRVLPTPASPARKVRDARPCVRGLERGGQRRELGLPPDERGTGDAGRHGPIIPGP